MPALPSKTSSVPKKGAKNEPPQYRYRRRSCLPSKAPSDGQYAMFQKAVERACEEVEVRHRNGDPDAATIVGRIILKLQALSPLMLEYGIPFPRSARGLPQCAPLLAMIRHAGMTWTKPVRELVNEMDKLHPKSMLAIRHLPEQAIDRAIDDYERKLVARGYGSPRSKSGGVDRIAAAEEIGCDPKELDVIARRRLSIINRQIGTPGPTTNRTGWSEGKRKYNPAVTQLINNGLERYFAGGLPEDPLNEGRIDFVTVAQTVGVAFGEIYDRPANVLMVESFAKGRPLLSNPFLAQRRYTYLDLMEYGYSRRDEEISAAGISASLVRRTTASLRAFILKVAAASLGAFVPLDFPQLVEQSLRARPSEHGSWWKEDMRRWILWNDELRAKKPLPDNFPLALRVLAHETGFTQNKLAVVSGINATILKSWLTGANTPSRSSQGHLARLASTLRVPVSIFTDLLSDAWRCRMLTSVAANYDSRLSRHLADNFSSMTVEDQRKEIDRAKTKYFNQDTPYSRRITEMSRDRYRLHKVNWPHAMQAAWDRQLPLIDSSFEEESWHMRIPGEELPPPSKQNGDISGSPQKYRAGTIDFKLGVAESILGYFSRPRELTAEQLEQSNMLDRSMTTTFRPAVGLGMPVDLLRPAIFLLPDLLTSFIWFRAKRSGAPGKMMLQALTLAAQFVRPEFGEVWKDPNMLDDLERIKKWWDANPHDFSEGDLKLDISPFRKNWKKAVKKVYKKYCREHKHVRNGHMPSTRDPFLPISGVINDEAPMEKYMIGVKRMLDSRPMSIKSRHVHVRDCILTLTLIQTGLRASTMLFAFEDHIAEASITPSEGDIRPKIIRRINNAGDLEWHISVPAIAFKNYKSEYFSGGRPYEHTLSNEDGLYDLLDKYISQSRPYLLYGRDTDAFFVTSHDTDFDGVALNFVYRRITRYYFVKDDRENLEGIDNLMSHGPHAVRHIIATHIMKTTGNLHLAAWAIQDSVRTIERHYARFFPRDKVRLAAEALALARAAGRARMLDARLQKAA